MFKPTLLSEIGEDISILIKLDNHPSNYICDCGEASKLNVKDSINTAAIFISHTHLDHFSNFDTILRHQLGIEKRIIVCGPTGIAKQLQAKINAYTWNLIEQGSIVYEIREIISENEIHIYEIEPPKWELKKIEKLNKKTLYKNDRFQVGFTILDHKTPSIAYLFKEKNTLSIELGNYRGGPWVRTLKEAFEKENGELDIQVGEELVKAKTLFPLLKIEEGNTLGIIMDHAANEANHSKIKNLFFNCDQVFIECFYAAEDKAFAHQNFHSYSTESGKIMRLAKVKKATPIHFSRKYNEDQIKALVAEFEAANRG